MTIFFATTLIVSMLTKVLSWSTRAPARAAAGCWLREFRVEVL